MLKKVLLGILGVILLVCVAIVGLLATKEKGEVDALLTINEKYNDSVDQYDYKVNSANGFSYIDFTLKGSPEVYREYFMFRGNDMFRVRQEVENGKVVKLLIDSYPNEFRKYYDAYDRARTLVKDNDFEYRMFMDFFDRISGGYGDSYAWEEVEQRSHKINRINEKVFKDFYTLPKEVQDIVDIPMKKYIKVDLYGSKYDYSGRYSFTDEFPETDYSGIR